ncbi:hypothetical protein DRW03_13140 [Corallococcus sp. H22C18031201]|uniref:hypothetical protein n=1 Tax=Citreicoccus inhibens TaxID=2849499 RepID=UPI000E716547|nr:hypothetical protein [Citreicoccus inhibens]MBU8894031.1 hypothetical protein [Citreicoccus inhibens]RJS23246.1 hypothetical protein DRW03_13140 [Corallococcus sp. H22C18031201]
MSWFTRVKDAVAPKLALPKTDLQLPSIEQVTQATVALAFTGAERGLSLLDKGVSAVAGKDSRAATVLQDLSRADFGGLPRHDGLRGDWLKLWGPWLREQKPATLGQWDTLPDGTDRFTVLDERYLEDLASRPHTHEATQAFFLEHPSPQPGDVLAASFSFTGEGSATGRYSAVEWFLGSHTTKVTCVSVDLETGVATLEYEVTSLPQATPARARAAEAELAPMFVADDAHLGPHAGLGCDFAQRYVWTRQVEVPTNLGPHG